MPADDLMDLPAWIRPGAKLAALGPPSVTLLTVKRFTRTQIVCATLSGTEYRFYRTPEMRSAPYGRDAEKTPEWRAVGDPSVTLVRRDHPDVVEERIRNVMRKAAQDVEASVRGRTSGWASEEEQARPIDERAMDFFDEIENIARSARRRVEQLTDPGGAVAAEYAAQYAQDLTTEETP